MLEISTEEEKLDGWRETQTFGTVSALREFMVRKTNVCEHNITGQNVANTKSGK